ncbi:hypothetical protein BV22DRAFT_423001 [Leucogyrophana mollusca]|uniref:Uncharacterized protein n=1 Tax=Leucogyrophana mollusca TaxID=85980 RepID=A0ACB8BJ00_9AGAM|nr:hypothetical protein BV22DRAFT_423001 [Leucogyrophana mollusca]
MPNPSTMRQWQQELPLGMTRSSTFHKRSVLFRHFQRRRSSWSALKVDFIWNRHWTIVTALYFVARYCGSVSQFAMLAETLPLNWTAAVNTSIVVASQVLSIVFTTAMQVILLLRAHALCNRSRKILVFLSASFVCEMIVIVLAIVKSLDLVAMGGLHWTGSVPRASSVNSYAPDLWITVYRGTQLAFDVLLLVVALFGSVKHALEAKGWSVSPLVKALAEDQIVYFVWYAVWQGTNLPMAIGIDVGIAALDGLNSFFGAFATIAGPRMVISLRAHELKTREGTLQTQLSTIRFNAWGSPSQLDAEEEPVHTRGSGSRRGVDAEA